MEDVEFLRDPHNSRNRNLQLLNIFHYNPKHHILMTPNVEDYSSHRKQDDYLILA